jgi:hypothetical protein
MTYAFSMDVPQPVEMYEKVHAALVQRLGRDLPEGCFMHFATRTDSGFRVTEVWESHEAADRFGDEMMRPLIAEVSGLSPEVLAQGPPPNQELDMIGLAVDARAGAAV